MTQLNNIIKVTLLMLCISALNVFAQKDDENQLQGHCCDNVKVSAEPDDDDPCCIKISVYNPNCPDLVIKIEKKLNNANIEVTKETVNNGEKKEFKVCGDIGESEMVVLVKLENKVGQLYCSGNTIHEFTRKVNCCKCPDKIDDIVNIDLIANACENGCKVKHTYNLPEEYNKCFKYIKIKSSEMDNEEQYYLEEAKDKIENYSPCIGNYEKYTVNLLLVKDDGEECKYEKTVYCKGKPIPLEELCRPDTAKENWNAIQELTIFSDICPGCTINVSYTWRKTSRGHQDVQIVKIEVLNDKCNDCSPEKLYQMALDGIIRENQMLFNPRFPGDCSDLWRVAHATCWSIWRYYYDDGVNVRYNEVYQRCRVSVCCTQKMRVCLDKDSNYIVTPLDKQIYYDGECAKHILDDWSMNTSFTCFPACEWLANYKGSTGKAPKKKDGASFKVDYENAYGINTGIEDNVIKVQIKTPKTGTAEVTVYDVSGKQVIKETAVITNGNTNTIMIGIAELQSGNYIYTVTIDGRKLESQKFNINK